MAEGSVFARVHVMVLCDDIAERPDEEELDDLIGVRTGVRADFFPYYHAQLCIYLQLSGHVGPASGQVVAAREETEEEVAYVPIDEIQLLGPLTLVPVRLRITSCEFPAPGVYWFQVILNQKLVAERRFQVLVTPGENNGRSTT
jgi:hypothetical protein